MSKSPFTALAALAVALAAAPVLAQPGGGPPPLPPPLAPPPVPAGNPITTAKTNLGKALFWDEQLSSTGTVSCGTCHHSPKGGSDPRSVLGVPAAMNPGVDGISGNGDDVVGSPGVPVNNATGNYEWSSIYRLGPQVTRRKAKSYVDAAYPPDLFWDGRASGTFRDPLTNAVVIANGAALESQVIGPPVDSGEMGHIGRDWNDVAADVAASRPLALSPSVPTALSTWIAGRAYPALFAEAFGSSEVTPTRIALAIATYERTLFSNQTPVDSGNAALTAAEQRGWGVFVASTCNGCHAGPQFSDNQYHYIGVRPNTEDAGRFEVTANNADRGAFRTPSLRNVELRAPLMHNGRFASLEDVVDFYNRGGDFNAPNKDPRIRPLGLNPGQRADLLAFLRRPLTDPRVQAEQSPFDRPTLYTESNRVPIVTGTGAPGTGGFTPTPVAIEPPIGGNPNFTVCVTGALGGSQARLVIDFADPGVTPTPPASPFINVNAVPVSGSGAGNGYASVVLALPNNVALDGVSLYGRWYVSDAGAPGGVSVSRAFEFSLFGSTQPPAGIGEFQDY